MKKNVANRGGRSAKKHAIRKTSGVKRKNTRKKCHISTKITAIVTAVLVFVLTLTILYTQVFKSEVDHFFAKKYTVTDVNGEKKKYTADELEELVTSDRFYQGIRIDGVDVSGKTMDEAKSMFSEIREAQLDELVDIRFKVGDDEVRLKTDGMSLSSNIDDVLIEAFYYAKSSTLDGAEGLIDRYDKITALQKTPMDFNSVFTIGDDNVSLLTHEALDGYNIAPVEAKATSFDVSELKFVIEESKSGQSVDIDEAIANVKASFAEKTYKTVIPVELKVVEPQTTAESLRSKLGRVSSNSSKTKDKPNRNTNIYLVCKAINGLVLQPGEQFDFNGVVGQRTPEKGYKEAPGILDGASNLEYGGGICQANTMLYHSVMEADLQVDERVAHSWPSDYVDIGTDATVSWQYPNFKFTNNTDYPIAIHAYYGDLWVTVEIFGRLLPDGQTIKFFGDPELLINEEPTHTEYVADPTLAVGEVVKERSAHNHILAKAYKVTYDASGNEIARKEIMTEYRLIEAKYRVGTLGPGGTIFKMDPSTGKVTPPDGYVPPTEATTPETQAPAETTEAPAETTAAPAE